MGIWCLEMATGNCGCGHQKPPKCFCLSNRHYLLQLEIPNDHLYQDHEYFWDEYIQA